MFWEIFHSWARKNEVDSHKNFWENNSHHTLKDTSKSLPTELVKGIEGAEGTDDSGDAGEKQKKKQKTLVKLVKKEKKQKILGWFRWNWGETGKTDDFCDTEEQQEKQGIRSWVSYPVNNLHIFLDALASLELTQVSQSVSKPQFCQSHNATP